MYQKKNINRIGIKAFGKIVEKQKRNHASNNIDLTNIFKFITIEKINYKIY
jgi:hypothetical protein